MSLALGVRAGDKVFIKDDPMLICKVGSGCVVVEFNSIRHDITEVASTEVAPDVFVALGKNDRGSTRLLFNAPSNITILREKLYRASTPAR